MSWELFKQNILRLSNNPDRIPDIGTVARTWAREYDAAVRRGFDTVNGVTIKTGNVQIMEQLFKAALQKGLTSKGPYDLVGEMGKGVLAYWTGATLNELPIPLIPSPGSTANVSVVSNVVTNIGQWIAEPTTAALLASIPDDNNTLEAAQKIAAETGPEILTDGGEDGGEQLNSLKSQLGSARPNYQISSTGFDAAGEELGDSDTFDGQPKETSCGTGLNYDAKLSPNFRLRDLSIGTTFPHKIRAQAGFDIDGIVCNLKHVAVNILEPLKQQYPNIKINSAFRGVPSIPGGVSQHQKGEAVDIQIPGLSPKQYLPVANWIKSNLPFDQMIFEHGNSIWIHISCSRTKSVQRKQLLTMLNGNYEPGIKCYYA